MYSFFNIGIDSDIEIKYDGGKFKIRVTEWKYYRIFNSLVLKIYLYFVKKGKLKQALLLLKFYRRLPLIKIRNKKYSGERFEYSIYNSDDMYAKLFDLQKEGLRCRLDLIIPCIQEDILLEMFNASEN